MRFHRGSHGPAEVLVVATVEAVSAAVDFAAVVVFADDHIDVAS